MSVITSTVITVKHRMGKEIFSTCAEHLSILQLRSWLYYITEWKKLLCCLICNAGDLIRNFVALAFKRSARVWPSTVSMRISYSHQSISKKIPKQTLSFQSELHFWILSDFCVARRKCVWTLLQGIGVAS